MPYADSEPATTSISFMGVWIHDPTDAEGTVRTYVYGADSRDTAVDVEASGTQYAGRAFPVVDFGEGETQTETIRIVIPHGPSYQEDLEALKAWARLRRTLHLRDNRGRNLRGTMSALRLTDAGHGSDAQFSFGRVHVTETMVE